MAVTKMWLIKRCAMQRRKEQISDLPDNLRGIYGLLKRRRFHGVKYFDVVYVGMSGGSIKARLREHKKNEIKGPAWTHFSAFVVRDNITESQVRDLEGILRHIYSRASRANKLAKAKKSDKLSKLRTSILSELAKG